MDLPKRYFDSVSRFWLEGTSVSDPEPDSRVFWIRNRIQGSSGSGNGSRGLKKVNFFYFITKFTTFYRSIDFFWWENVKIMK